MPSTVNYALPYPIGTDPPDGAAQIEDLAENIDTDLAQIHSRIRPYGAIASTNVDLTATHVDVPGTSVTFTTNHPNATLLVWAAFGLAFNNTPGQEDKHLFGLLSVDGAEFSRQVIMRATANARRTCRGSWTVHLSAAASHTVKLRTWTTRVAGSADCNDLHTGWVGILFD